MQSNPGNWDKEKRIWLLQQICHSYLEREKKGWNPKYDGCQVEEATNGQSYDWEDEEAVWWWVLAGDWCSQGSCDQWLHGSLHGSGIGKRRLSMARGDYSTLSVIKVTINRAGGCWHSKFITLISPKPWIYIKQVTVEQHVKEIYYLETKNLLFKKAPTHSNQQLVILREHFCAKLVLSDYKEFNPEIFLALLHDTCLVGI